MGRSSVVVGSSCRRRACGMLNTVPLWAHQRAEIDASWSVPARARLWEPRLGKTRVCAVEMRRLWEGGHITRFLVACPKTVAGVWRDELALCFPDAQALDLSDGRVADRFARLRQATTSGPVVVIVNYDVVHRALIPLLQWKPQYIVADEMHRLKSPGARRSRAMHQLGGSRSTGAACRERRIRPGGPTSTANTSISLPTSSARHIALSRCGT